MLLGALFPFGCTPCFRLMTLARSLPTAGSSSIDTASTRVLGEGAACKDSEPLVRSLTACHLPADTHSNDHAQTLIDEVCECCFSAYCSRASQTTRRLFSRDPAYRKPIQRWAVLSYSFSDERPEMKRSDPPLLNANATLRSSRRRSAEIRPAAPLGICLRASTTLTSQLVPHQAFHHDCRQASAALNDSLKHRALWQYAAGAPCTCQDDHTLSLPSGPHTRCPLLVSRNIIFQSTTDQRARPALVEQQGDSSL